MARVPTDVHQILTLADDFSTLARIDADAEAHALADGAPLVRTRTRLGRAALHATLTEAHDDRVARSYAVLALACAECERLGRGGRRGPRASHLARLLSEEWAPWGWQPWLGERNQCGVGAFLREHAGSLSVCGLGVRVLPDAGTPKPSWLRYATFGRLATPLTDVCSDVPTSRRG